MARDKLITIRIEGEKRKAFGELAKSQNTDTASLLYDFINQCLSGKIDIGIVTGKKQWIDKIDNQLDSNRLDKLEATTQEIDKRLGNLSKKVTDWVIAFDDCLNDCDRELSEKINNLEHRLNALASQLDSQQDRQQIDSIDIDSQLDRQRETPDMGTVVTVEAVYTVETADTVEPDSIETVTGDSSHLKNQLVKAVDVGNRQGLTNQQLHEKTNVPVSTIEKWKGKIKIGEPIVSKRYPDFFKQWSLDLTDSLWYEVD